jgi:hypothetical protein
MCKKLVPTTPSSAILDTGLTSVNDLLGSARLSIKPIFAISRATMYLAIKDGRLPPPIKLSSRFMVWESRVIKALVSDLEAQGEVL